MKTLEELIANKNDYYINYIENITKHHCRKDAIDIFHEYFQSKEELFQCLGRKLSVSKHVSVDLQETAIMYQLEKLYEPMQDYNTAIKNKSEFIDTVHKLATGLVIVLLVKLRILLLRCGKCLAMKKSISRMFLKTLFCIFAVSVP